MKESLINFNLTKTMRKELFGALLGGALLAACTSDDVLNVSVSQDVNPQAPVFTVSVGDIEDTRAGIGDGTDVTLGNLYLEENDVMSLFHGVSVSGNSGSFTGYGNAVYQGAMKDDAFEYTTKSMVNEGYAVMVFPADTTFVNNKPTTDQPYVEVSLTQTKKTTERTPFISEIIEVNPYNAKDVEDGKTDNMAGYGHKYDLKLKRAAATMALAINAIDENPERWEEVGGLDITSIKIEATSKATGSDGENKKIFASQMEIGIGTGAPYSKDTYKNWKQVSEAKAKENSESNAIEYSFADNEEGDLTAYYTLLPFANDLNELLKTKTEPNDILEDVTITVNTNYGYVQFKGDSKDKIWTNKGTKMTILEGVADALKSAFAASTGNTFKGETVGRYLPRTIDVTLGDLVMNDLHIQNETQLINVMTVYNGLTADAKAQVKNFYLDGTNGEFTITSQAALENYDAALTAGITFTPCPLAGEKCNTVVLNMEGATVPERLSFASNVNVRLEGSWTLNGADENVYEKVKELQVADEATLTLVGEIRAYTYNGGTKKSPYNTQANAPWLVNYGDIDIASKVTLMLNTANYKNINIENNAELNLDKQKNGIVLNNLITKKKDLKGYNVEEDGDFVERGEINLLGNAVIGIVENSGCSINNFGRVNIASKDATVLVSTNGTEEFKFTEPMSITISGHSVTGNLAGEVILPSDATDDSEKFVVVKGEQGFIKTERAASTIANYCIIKSTGNVTAPSGAKVKYVDVMKANGTLGNMTYTGAKSGALILRTGVRLSVASNVTISADKFYLKGRVVNGGAFNWTADNIVGSYFGGDSEDYKMILVPETE